MRLLIMTPEFDGFGGGIITFYRELVPALVRAGVDVTVIEGSAFNTATEKTHRNTEGFTHTRLEAARVEKWSSGFQRFESMPGLRRHLAAAFAMWDQVGRGEHYDVVEAVDWGMLFAPPVLQGAAPTVVQCHASVGQIAEHDPIAGESAQDLLIQLLEKELMTAASMVQTYSPANAIYWRERCGRDVEMIPPAWRPKARISVSAISDRALVVGRMQQWKGPEPLCAALARLEDRAPGVDWIGRDMPWGVRDSSTAQYLQSAYPDVWRDGLVRLANPTRAEEIARLQASARFNIVPSTWDVFNFTVPEAMSSGRPLIVSTGAGASYLVEDGVSGFTFEAGRDDRLADAISRALACSPSELSRIAERARAVVERDLDPDRSAQMRVSAYRACMARSAATTSRNVEWLEDVLRPSQDGRARSGSFLEQHPLRNLSRHVIARSSRKIRGFLRSAKA